MWNEVKSKILGSSTGGDGGSRLCVYEIFSSKMGWNQQSISKGNKFQMMACLYIFQLWKLSTQFTDYLLSSVDWLRLVRVHNKLEKYWEGSSDHSMDIKTVAIKKLIGQNIRILAEMKSPLVVS